MGCRCFWEGIFILGVVIVTVRDVTVNNYRRGSNEDVNCMVLIKFTDVFFFNLARRKFEPPSESFRSARKLTIRDIS